VMAWALTMVSVVGHTSPAYPPEPARRSLTLHFT
jgi:hypothetical protein